MKKGDFLKIEGTEKKAMNMNGWSEYATGKRLYKAGSKFYHVTWNDKKINKFASIETCFTPYDCATTNGFANNCRNIMVYEIVLLKDIEVEMYGWDEARFIPTPENCTVQYIGTLKDSRYGIMNKWGRIETMNTIASFDKTHKDLEKIYNEVHEKEKPNCVTSRLIRI